MGRSKKKSQEYDGYMAGLSEVIILRVPYILGPGMFLLLGNHRLGGSPDCGAFRFRLDAQHLLEV